MLFQNSRFSSHVLVILYKETFVLFHFVRVESDCAVTKSTMKNTPRLLLFVYLCLTTAIGWIEALLPKSILPFTRVVSSLSFQQISSIVQAFKVDEVRFPGNL
jgi:hypothetical protein